MSSTHEQDTSPAGLAPADVSERADGAAWLAVASISLSVFGLATAEFLPASLLTPVAGDLGVSIGAAGQAVTATAAVAAMAGPALIAGSARYDRRTIVWSVSLLVVLSDLLAAVASNIWVFLGARVVLGIALGGIGSLAAALCMRLVPPALFSRAMAMVFTGMTAAAIFAPPFGVYMGRVWGWRATFIAAAAVSLLALLTQVATLPRMAPSTASGHGAFSRLLARPGVRLALISGMLIISGHSAGFTYVRPFMEQVPRLDIDMISVAFVALGVAGFFGNIAGGFAAGRSPRLSTGFAAMIIAAATLALLVFGQSPVVALMAAGLWGFGFGATPISVQTMTVQMAPDHAEGVGALTMSAFQVAIAAGAVVGGALVDHLGPPGAIGFCTLASCVGGCLILLPERRR